MATPDEPICSVGWGQRGEAVVATVAELDRVLDELTERHWGEDAVLAEVSLPIGDALSVGLGHERSVLSFVPGTGLPPYFISRGPTEHGDGLAFYYYGQWTHFDERNLISLGIAREAVRQFVRTGNLANSVPWEET